MSSRTRRVGIGERSRTAAPAPPTGVAVIGARRSGRDATRVLAAEAGAEVRWVCDLDRDRLLDCQRLHPGVSTTGRIERVLRDPTVEAIVIATPPPTRYRLASKALAADKHVFTAEPVAMAAELLDELAAVAEEHGRLLMCGHATPISPSARAIRHAIAGGALGQITTIASRGSGSSEAADGCRLIAEVGPSEFAMVLYWLSEMPTHVRACGPAESGGNGSTVRLNVGMTFASGVAAKIALGGAPWLEPRRITVTGSTGSAVYDHAGEQSNPLAPQMSEFLAAIADNRRLEFEAAIARGVVRICEAAQTSLRHGGEDVALGSEGNRADRLPHLTDGRMRRGQRRASSLAA